MGVNIVKYGNQTLIDLTDTTAVASDVAQGKHFYGKDGVKTEGTATGGGSDGSTYQDQDGYVVLANEGGFSVMQEITISTDGAVTQELQPNILYHFTGTLTSLTITLATTQGIAYYHFDFNSGSTAVQLSLPQTVTMPDDFSVEASYRYEIDILNTYGTVQKWSIT